MKIATWNVNEFVGITTDLDNQETTETVNKANIEEMINVLNENDFDIVCFTDAACHKNFVGIQPLFKQVPPKLYFSIITTFFPCLAKFIAQL